MKNKEMTKEMLIQLITNKRGSFANRIMCLDGFTLSVQASRHHYCKPREDSTYEKPVEYTHVEVGFAKRFDDDLLKYSEEPDTLETVYPFTPIDVVVGVINKHGWVE